jgi:hypothetical protein
MDVTSTISQLEVIRDALQAAAVVFCFITAVLVLAFVDVGLTLLLVRWSCTLRKLSHLPQPEAPESLLPKLPDDHKVVVIGGGIKRWE